MASYAITGRVVDARTGGPLAGLRVEAWDRDLLIDDLLGSATTDAEGRFTIEFDRRYYQEIILDRRPDVYFRVLRGGTVVADTSGQVSWNVREPELQVTIPVAVATAGGGGAPGDGGGPALAEGFGVDGRVTTGAGVAVPGARVEVWDRRLEGDKLLAVAATDAAGRWSAPYDRAGLDGKPRADLFVRVVQGRDGDGVEVARSATVFQAEPRATVDLSVDAAQVTRASEYERLLQAAGGVAGNRPLAQLDARGVEYVAGRTGWDARLVAMAARAEALAGETGIPAPHYYALLRAGTPGDLGALHRLPEASVQQGLQRAVDTGVIPGGAPVDETLRIHRERTADALRDFAPPSAVSSLGEMLAISLEPAQTDTFLQAYAATAGNPDELWTTLEQRGFDAPTVARLRTEGKLGYLTRQNAPLVARLTNDVQVASAEDLPRAGLYRADAWMPLIANDVPAGIGIDDYAAGLAAQVNLAYPNLVVGEMLRRGELRADPDGEAGEEVAAFFSAGQGKHAIGAEPVKHWASYGQLSPAAQAGARRVERLYQLTPSNESMAALDQLGMHSALQIAREPRDRFMARHAEAFPSPAEAELVHRKAQEVHTRALHLATTYLSYRTAPDVYAVTGGLSARPSDQRPAAPGVPTLEDLLKDMDYCACDHCRSVLSPAAYLVELLEFIDVPDVPAGRRNPQTVLLERRPDLQDLLLSCENTNVALPYVDLVNEILEHFIIDGSLAAFHGFNMREDSRTADLLADPEHVRDAAYEDHTRAEVYPHGLPFDMPLAALRLFMRAFDTTLPGALRVFRTPAAARREALELNADEYRILTQTGFRQLPEYFGEPAATSIAGLNAAVAEGKTFSRRTDISYEELVGLLRTRFINPGAPLVPLLQELGIPLPRLHEWFEGDVPDTALQADFPPGLDPARVLQRLRNNRDLIMGLVVLADMSEGEEECSFATVELRLALPNAAANRLTAFHYHKLHRFIRLWKKLGLDMELTDRLVVAFLGTPPESLTLANLDATFTSLLARLGNFAALRERRSISEKKIADWLPVWDAALPAQTRRETLAHLLRVGATDLEHFAEITGIDPLAADMDADAPSLPRFLDAWDVLKGARLKVADLDWLLRHRDDAGTLTPPEAALLRDLKALRDGLTAVEAELGTPPANADLALVRARMSLVYAPAVVDRFVGLVGGTTTYEAPLATVEEALPDPLTAVDPRLGYDPFGKAATWSGIMSAASRAALDAAADTLVLADVDVITTQAELDDFVADFKAAALALFGAGQAELALLNAEYPELKAVYDAVAGIADPAAQAAALLDQVLPELRRQLKAAALRTTLGSLLKTDRPLVDVLTEGPAVLRAVSNAAQGVLRDFAGLETPVAFNASQAFSIHLDPPATDSYILYVAAPAGTTVTLAVDGAVVIPATAVGAPGEVQTAAELVLRAGVLTPAVLTLAGLPAGTAAELRWRTRGMAKTPVPASRVYAGARLAEARASLLRLQKAALLLRALPLTPRELRHLVAVNPDTAGLLNGLDVDGSIGAGALQAQWGRLSWVAWFSALKASEGEPDTWVGLLEDPDRTTPQGGLVMAAVLETTDADLAAVLVRFGLAVGALSALRQLRRVKEAVDFVANTGQPAADLIGWTTDAPDAALIAGIKESLRARHSQASWQETLQGVNDALRNQRRDALVTYILHHQRPAPAIDTADKLYEHFLVDVAMDACMTTSRIRLALSTVQLFVTRCLMNLEPQVSASSINAEHWAWMKRYRVWEANRKIFLYPENWLEPELRDNKSPFFRELESELLKADITDELAEDAYLSYLKKLDEVARLEIMGAYLQERNPAKPDDDILHVFGRTNGNTHQYYYRRYEGGYWTPWEKVSLAVEGDVLLPVIWKSRLFLFWLTQVPKPEGAKQQDTDLKTLANSPWGGHARKTVEVTLSWGEYYRGKWTSPRSSEMKDPIRLTNLVTFEPDRVILAARTHKPGPDVSERLIVNLVYLGTSFQARHAVFTSKNAPPMLYNGVDDTLFDTELESYFLLWDPAPGSVPRANALREPGKLFKVRIGQPPGAHHDTLDETLLTKTAALADGFTVRPLLHPVQNRWESPLFYHDEHATFFITPDERVTSVGLYDGYFLIEAIVPGRQLEVEIPPLYEKPAIRDPRDPIWNPPLETVVNDRYAQVISGGTPFVYGGVAFGAGGAVLNTRGVALDGRDAITGGGVR